MNLNIDKIISEAVQKKASDIHIVANYPVTLRIFGNLKPASEKLVSEKDLQELIRSILTVPQQQELDKTKDVDFPISISGQRVRVNAHLQQGTPALSMRLISTHIPSIQDLNLPPILKTFADLSQGLVLVTGPTGSGKSTSQAAMIRHICETQPAHIITTEDPIEYVFPPSIAKKGSVIEQRELGRDTPTFASALKHALRQDPDVILIGEMRDYETISVALTAAETGHLVISTLHTTDAVQSIDRMIDVFPPHQQAQVRTQLSLILEGICSQHIFPRADNSGSVVAMEILVATPAIRNLIRTAKTPEIYSMIEMGKELGMQSMDDAIEKLLFQNLVTPEVVKPYIKKPQRIEKYVYSQKNRAA